MTTIADFHTAIKDQITAYFGTNINTVEWYEQGEELSGQPKTITTPAIILEIESADEGDDLGDDRTPLNCHITAYCILGQRTPNLQIEVRNFAAQLFSKIRKNKWGLGRDVSNPGGCTLGPGRFDPEKQGYDSWYVSWQQTIYLGDSVWQGATIMPTEIYWSQTPEIGAANKEYYTREMP